MISQLFELIGYVVIAGLVLMIFFGSNAEAKALYPDITVDHIERVYDGDTMFVDIAEWPAIIGSGIGIRVRGIDTPEIRGKCTAEKLKAVKAKHRLENILKSADKVILKNVQRGKYFRIVADVYADEVNAGMELVKEGLAVQYFGKGKKKKWC